MNRIQRENIADALRRSGGRLTPKAFWILVEELELTKPTPRFNWPEYKLELFRMEPEQLVFLHRDTSQGQRHTADWGGIALIVTRAASTL